MCSRSSRWSVQDRSKALAHQCSSSSAPAAAVELRRCDCQPLQQRRGSAQRGRALLQRLLQSLDLAQHVAGTSGVRSATSDR